jgi:hypothetical protein
MNRHVLRGASLATLLVALACQKGDKPAEAATTGAGGDVDRAVAVTLAIKANPEAAESVLTAHSLTVASFDSLMWVIAMDSAKAVAYKQAIE